jgi:hypothetical protein
MRMDWAVPLLLAACVDERHVMVRDSMTSPERRYVCAGAVKAQPAPICADATEDIPGSDNGDDTILAAMPHQCNGRINEVYVRNAHSKSPTIFVRCAAAETPIGDAGPP